MEAANTTPVMLMTDSNFLQQVVDALAKSERAIAAANEMVLTAQKIADDNKLLNEAEAVEYLRRDADTLAYYRNHGLESYKRGRDRWYRKGDIDRWLDEGKVNRRVYQQ